MKDRYNRQLNYLRLSVTDRCNLRCQYCMPESGAPKKHHTEIMRNEEFVSLVEVMATMGVDKVRLTGGEPLVRNGFVSLFESIVKIQGIKDVSLTTNGILLKNHLDDLVKAGLKRINISLDSLNPKTFKELTRGGELKDVLLGIKMAKERGLSPIKINVVIIRGVNDHEVNDFLDLVDEQVEVRFIELMPIGEAAKWTKDKFMSVHDLLAYRDDLVPMVFKGDGGPCRYFKYPEKNGYVGIINPISDHFCNACNRLRVTADGMLKTCLHDDREFDIRSAIGDAEQLKKILLEAVDQKPKQHALAEGESHYIKRSMYTIGG